MGNKHHCIKNYFSNFLGSFKHECQSFDTKIDNLIIFQWILRSTSLFFEYVRKLKLYSIKSGIFYY